MHSFLLERLNEERRRDLLALRAQVRLEQAAERTAPTRPSVRQRLQAVLVRLGHRVSGSVPQTVRVRRF